mgnify:CR=1 FL=1
MYGGLATPSEAAALGVVGAFLVSWKQGALNPKVLRDIAMGAVQTCSVMGMIILGASVLGNITSTASLIRPEIAVRPDFAQQVAQAPQHVAQGGCARFELGIVLQGETVSDGQHHMPAEQRRIGMVFQDYALFPHLDVGKNIAFGIDRLPRAERDARVAEVLKLVGLDGMQKRFPHELSGGQQQRVALARALAPRPRLLLLDEPFSNLDVDLRERLAHEVRGILKAAGATALFVTHDQLEAFAIGDVIGVMHEGHLHQWEDAYALYHRPATRFVAEFIGHGVFAPAQISQVGNDVSVQTPLGALQDVDECPLPTAYASGLCDVLLRADDIVHDDHAPVKAQIVRKAFRGSEFLYTLQLGSGLQVMAHVPSHHDHAVGEWIGIKAQVDHVVTFARGA